jgi:phage shock protein A
MGWLVIQLPNRLQQLETQMAQILTNQNAFSLRFEQLEKQVTDLDRRTIRLELNR